MTYNKYIKIVEANGIFQVIKFDESFTGSLDGQASERSTGQAVDGGVAAIR